MLLGYRFSPRLADLGETRFYRINSSANYGPLNSIARHRINTDLIARNWDDLLRVAGSLKLGFVSAHDLMRTFQGSGRNYQRQADEFRGAARELGHDTVRPSSKCRSRRSSTRRRQT